MSGVVIWRDTFSVGVPAMDEHHRKLLALLGEAREAASGGAPVEDVSGKLKSLYDFTRQHFKDEEKLMEQAGFDGFARHRQSHLNLIRELNAIIENFRRYETNAKLVRSLDEFIKTFFNAHVRVSDIKYAASVNKNASGGA